MAATKTLALVLAKQDYRDTSLLVDFYTQQHGKIKGIIKGIRDGRERYGSTLEPFSLNEILFYKRKRGGDLHQVTQVELVDLFGGVREDLERLSYASYFIELIDELTEAEEEQPEIFQLVLDLLAFLGSGASAKRAARIFEIKFFEILGFMPEIKACVICRTEFPDPAFFSVRQGGIYCKACAARAQGAFARNGSEGAAVASTGVGIPVSRGAINFLEHARRAEVKDLYHVKVSQEVGSELEKVLRRFVDFHLQRKLNSVTFMEKMGFD